MSNGVDQHFFTPQNDWEDAVSPPHDPDSAQGLHFSDSDSEDDTGAADEADAHTGDYSHYSQQMSEFFDNDTNQSDDGLPPDALDGVLESDEEEEDDEEGFLYTGVDAPGDSVPYRDQLRDALGNEHDEESTGDAEEGQLSPLEEEHGKPTIVLEEESLVCLPADEPVLDLTYRSRHHPKSARRFFRSSPPLKLLQVY